MTTNAEWITVDPQRILAAIEDAAGKVRAAQGEVVLDFVAVGRIDTKAVEALEQLAAVAAEKPATVVLRGVNGDVYKVLKLLRLTDRFSFAS